MALINSVSSRRQLFSEKKALINPLQATLPAQQQRAERHSLKLADDNKIVERLADKVPDNFVSTKPGPIFIKSLRTGNHSQLVKKSGVQRWSNF